MNGKQVLKPLWARLFGVRCPICGFRDVRFRGSNGRPNAKCAGCGSVERHRLFWAFLQARLGASGRLDRVLHFAPEGFLAPRLRALSELYVSVDIDRPDTDVTADVTKLPFTDDAFDVVVCSHVLEHVRDDATAMRELRRVLRPGGWMVADVPQVPGQEITLEDPDADARTRIEVYQQIDHVRLYGRTDYVRRLTEAGFDVAQTTGRHIAGRGARRNGVLPNRILFVCS